MDILNKYNIPAISPLQDINRFTYNAARPFKALPTASTYPTLPPSYSTHQPFKHSARKPDSDYKHQHHKVSYPSYGGARYPFEQHGKMTKKPFLPTPDTSPDLAITHSFFTIEDAITHAPGHGLRAKPMGGISTKANPLDDYRRQPLYPTVVNQIEDNIRKPLEEQITEVSTVGEEETDTTLQPPPSSASVLNRQRQRNKVRRKRPRPTSESTNEVTAEEQPQQSQPPQQPQRNPMQNHRNRLNDEREVTTRPTIPKNHKEFSPATRDRETLMQRPKETTTAENTQREVTTVTSHRSPTRSRPSTDVETFSSKPQKPKDQRRPNNRFEDNKIPRFRPQTTTKSTFSRDPEEHESTTIITHVPKYKSSRRPIVTTSTTSSDDEYVTDGTRFTTATASIENYPQTRLPPRTRSSSATTPLSPTTQRMTASSTVSGHPHEDNGIIMATKIGVTGEGKYTTEREFISYEEESNEGKYPQHVGEISTQSTTTTTTTSTESIEPAQSETHREAMVTSDGPVYRPIDPMKPRNRLRQKEKILEAAEKASRTSSTTTRTSTPKEQDSSSSSSADKSNEVLANDGERARLPLHKGTVKVIEISTETGNSTKSKRINGNTSSKYDSKNRPRFSVKEYRQRLTSTTTVDPVQQSSERESTTASYTRLRFPTRNRFYTDIKNKSQDTTKATIDEKLNLVIEAPERSESEDVSSETPETTRKRFSPKDRFSSKVKSTTEGSTSGTSAEAGTVKPTTRRGSTRREYGNNRLRYSTSTSTSVHTSSIDTSTPSSRITTVGRNVSSSSRRPINNIGLRQRIQSSKPKDSVSDETINDLAIENSSDEHGGSTEEYKHETAIMKIAKDDHSYRHRERTTSSSSTETSIMSVSENDLSESPSHQSERVAELTIFGSNNFNSVNKGTSSRRVPGYFTIATEDPILPIEAFFPQVKRH